MNLDSWFDIYLNKKSLSITAHSKLELHFKTCKLLIIDEYSQFLNTPKGIYFIYSSYGRSKSVYTE